MAAPGPADAHTYTYSVETRGSVRADRGEFARYVRSTLTDPRGWSLNGKIRFRPVSTGAHVRLILASPQAVARAHPVCSSTWSCRVGNQVLINDDRWRTTTPTWPRSRRDYRHYVINHEVGHWLGLPGRQPCPGRGEEAPVMMQQSKGLDGCEATVWPLPRERARAAEIREVTTFSQDRSGSRGDAPEWPGRYLRLAQPLMRGEDVRRYQARMRERGWRNSEGSSLGVDGVFGPETARATRLFQREKGLGVDGIVGLNTWRAAWTEPIT